MPGTSMWCSTRWRAESALVLALGLAAGWPVLASTTAPQHGSAPRPSAQQAGAHQQLPGSRLQGEATLRYFGLRVYNARLWTLPDFRASQPVDQPLLLELEYLRELRGSAIAERSLKEMARGGSFSEAQAQRWLSGMLRIFTDVKTGDRISGQHLPGQGARFWLNGRPTGQIDDPDFARLFFGIWLAPTTSEPGMRLSLLGQSDSGLRQ